MPLHDFLQLLNEYETDLYFLQSFQSNRTVCLIIHMFCKGYEREIFWFDFQNWQNNFRFTTYTKNVNQQGIDCKILA